ncbi:MAG: hypothetical protein SGJ04_10690 [Bacteroidota bacterium]|nr:hypothetical protein [Bacteroidota bacterium]
MAWYIYYLPNYNPSRYNWTVIVLFGFEVAYIGFQAGCCQISHFNNSSPIYAGLYALMGIAATAVTLYTAYIGVLFFTTAIPSLPSYYLWGIRWGIFVFVIFALEGFVMGGRMSHTIGGPDANNYGIPILNWSTKYGDPRVAHFIGMHALQLLPLLSFYLIKNTRGVFIISILYTLLAIFTLMRSLKGKPILKSKVEVVSED